MKKFIFALGVCLFSLLLTNQTFAQAAEASGFNLVYELEGDAIELVD